MSASSDRQRTEVTDDEAEAVLLALGPQLEWTISRDRRSAEAVVASGCYDVRRRWSGLPIKALPQPFYAVIVVICFLIALALELRDIRWLFHRYRAVYTWADRQRERAFFTSWEAATAACEHHHATGEWPPSAQSLASDVNKTEARSRDESAR